MSKKSKLVKERKARFIEVPFLHVVIINPNHYAVALRYEKQTKITVVTAKGMNERALCMKAVARKNKVLLYQRPLLARSLYAEVDVGQEIPESFISEVTKVFEDVVQLQKRICGQESSPLFVSKVTKVLKYNKIFTILQ